MKSDPIKVICRLRSGCNWDITNDTIRIAGKGEFTYDAVVNCC